MNMIERLQNGTIKTMKETLKAKGIKVNSKLKKSDIQSLIGKSAKSLSMGNRTGNFVFGSKRNTHAGKVCLLIAQEEVKSKKDIRVKYTSKYSFKQTLERLASEGIIKFTDKKRSQFELTEKGIAIGKKQAKFFG